MIGFPQTSLYNERVTMGAVESSFKKQYDIAQNAVLLGHFDSSGNWVPSPTTTQFQSTLYKLVSAYYENSVIGCDDITFWVKRFNTYFDVNYEKFVHIINKDGSLPVGTRTNYKRSVNDQNTLNNGYTDKYGRSGSNSYTTTSTSNTQNAVTNRETLTGKNENVNKYGEGSELTRTRDGKTDVRDTVTTYDNTIITANDIEKYLTSDYIATWIDSFYPLFMEVYTC